jgi:tetratricopeptide (TPR) repeat protein
LQVARTGNWREKQMAQSTYDSPESSEFKVRKKEAEAEMAIQDGNYADAARLFKELAEIYFGLEEFDIALRCLDKEEDAKFHASHQGETSGLYVKYLMPLQVKAETAMAKGNINQAKDFLNQLIAIAEQFRLIDFVKAYKKKLMDVSTSLGSGSEDLESARLSKKGRSFIYD